MLVRLLKTWRNGDTDYTEGKVLNVDDEAVAKSLIKDGTAEEYTEKAPDDSAPKDDGKETSALAAQLKELSTQFAELKTANDGLAETNTKLADTLTDYRKIQGRKGIPNVKVGPERLVDDPLGGYGPGYSDEPEKNEAEVRKAMAIFGCEVHVRESTIPKRLSEWNSACKAAGDGVSGMFGYEGAYLLPTAMGALIDRITLEQAVIRPRATVIPMATRSIPFPIVDDTTHAGGTVFGGIAAYWKGEEAQMTASKPTFSSVDLICHKLTVFCHVSGEMLDWSPISMGTWLPNKMAQAIAWKEDTGFISGTGGAGEPIGIINSACKIEVSKEATQSADTILFENVNHMSARVWAPDRSKLIWIANHNCKPALATMYIAFGTAGGFPVFLPGNQVTGAGFETLYGHPIVFTEHAETLGDAGDLVLVNVAEYLVGDGSGKMRTDRTIALKFDYDQETFKVITYVGGLMPWRTQLTPEHGDTLSPVVTLEAR